MVEKQVYEFTIKTFNDVLGFLQSKETLQKDDYIHIGNRLLRLYQVWQIVWDKGGLKATDKWKGAIRTFHTSGVLAHIQPLLHADEDVRGKILWKLLNSETFLMESLQLIRSI